jgi:type I restriction enzyme S subunit
MSAPFVQLGDLVWAHYGKALKQEDRDSTGSAVVYGSSGEVGRHARALTDAPTIVVGRKGAVGTITYAPNGGWVIDTAYFLEPKNPRDLDLRYLFHALRNADLAKDTITTSIPGLNRDDLLANVIRLPRIEEQERIAAILDKADSLHRKRQEAIRVADEFLRSAYLDLARKHPARASIESVLAEIPNAARTGPFGSQLLVSEFTDSGVPVLGIDNVVSNNFTWGARRFVSPEKYAELERYTVRPGDVMVTIMGTTGRVAVAPQDLPLCISTKHLCTLSLDQQRMRPFYLWACLRWDPEVRAQTQRESKGAIMEGWNMSIVKGLMVSKPPLDAQLKFEKLLARTGTFCKNAGNAADEMGALIASLSAKYLGSPIAA